MAEYPQFNPYITKASQQYGVPPKLIEAVIWAETNGRNVVNSAGSAGIMQIHLPSHPNVSRKQALNPAFNIDYGVRYLAQLKKQFGSWRLALAGYNAGPGNVTNGRWQSFKETSDYVRKILARVGAMTPVQAQRALQTAPGPSGPSPGATGAPSAPGVDLAGIARAALARRAASGSYNPVEALTETTRAITTARQASSASPEVPPQEPPTIPGREVAGGGTSAPLKGSGGWYGSQGFADSLLAGIELGRTGKRNRRNTTTGSVSDHYVGNKRAFAYDLSDGDHPTPGMDRAAKQILSRLGVKWDGKSPIEVTKQVGKYRVQVLYRTQVGGNHNDHIHVGVRFTG